LPVRPSIGSRTTSQPTAALRQHDDRDRGVVAGGRRDDERVEHLVVAEDRRYRVRAASVQAERADRVEQPPATTSSPAAAPIRGQSSGMTATPSQPSPR
jgi:hypothetical protein